jgi:hypothetical protein
MEDREDGFSHRHRGKSASSMRRIHRSELRGDLLHIMETPLRLGVSVANRVLCGGLGEPALPAKAVRYGERALPKKRAAPKSGS